MHARVNSASIRERRSARPSKGPPASKFPNFEYTEERSNGPEFRQAARRKAVGMYSRATASGAVRRRLPTGCWVVGWGGRRVAAWGSPAGRGASPPGSGMEAAGGRAPFLLAAGWRRELWWGTLLSRRPYGGGVSACHVFVDAF